MKFKATVNEFRQREMFIEADTKTDAVVALMRGEGNPLSSPKFVRAMSVENIEESEENNFSDSLDVFYAHQLVINERVDYKKKSGRNITYNPLQHAPILAGSVAGSIHYNEECIQTFTIDVNGKFTFKDVNVPMHEVYREPIKVLDGSLNNANGGLFLEWNMPVGNSYIIMSYEYNMLANQGHNP